MYFCGQESLRRNRVDIIIKKRIQNTVELFSFSVRSTPATWTLQSPCFLWGFFCMRGFPVLHYLLEFAQTHVHWVDDAIQPSHLLESLLLLPSVLPSTRVFSSEWALCIKWPKYWSFTISLANDYQGWFPKPSTWEQSQNDKMISVHFQGKPFNITAIQVYALTTNAKEVE